MIRNALRLAGVADPVRSFGSPARRPTVDWRTRTKEALSASMDLGRIAVMGAGAVGCYYGGMLARAGHDVMLIARAQHVEAVRRSGLRLQTNAFDASVPMQVSEEPSAARGAKLVLFSVKSPDTERAGAALAPHLDPDAVVLSLQNGVATPSASPPPSAATSSPPWSTSPPKWPPPATSSTTAAASW